MSIMRGGRWPLVLISLVLAAGCAAAPEKPSPHPATVLSRNAPASKIQDPVMQYKLGIHYLFGFRVEQNYGKALKWFRKSARQGYTSAQNNLGTMYAQGLGVSRDYNEAFKWLDQAARRGNADAQQNLGLMYASGQGVPQNYRKAFMWFRLSAAQGHSGAQAQLGGMYSEGVGVHRDDARALKWFRKAAGQGNPYAQYHLGVRYREGRGLPVDKVQAYKWILLSSQNPGEEFLNDKNTLNAEIRQAKQQLEEKMTPGQLQQARDLARQWKPDPHAQSNTPPPHKPFRKKRLPKTVKS